MECNFSECQIGFSTYLYPNQLKAAPVLISYFLYRKVISHAEMILIAEVDLSLLHELHSYGSVRNLKDRRKDFYQLKLITGDKHTRRF